MRKIIYYVATSLDGFICGPNNSIKGFVEGGNGVEQYFSDLAAFDTVIMGRNTYEFGYQFGLEPGQPAYPQMTHFIFSNGLKFDNPNSKVHVKKLDIEEIKKLKAQPGTDIYLCGGGQLAGWLLAHEQIDMLKIKLNPLVLGQGTRLFGNSTKSFQIKLLETKAYDHGLQIITYAIHY
jgi:dihydrofolate reductase